MAGTECVLKTPRTRSKRLNSLVPPQSTYSLGDAVLDVAVPVDLVDAACAVGGAVQRLVVVDDRLHGRMQGPESAKRAWQGTARGSARWAVRGGVLTTPSAVIWTSSSNASAPMLSASLKAVIVFSAVYPDAPRCATAICSRAPKEFPPSRS